MCVLCVGRVERIVGICFFTVIGFMVCGSGSLGCVRSSLWGLVILLRTSRFDLIHLIWAKKTVVWRMAFLAIVWVIWRLGNKIVFHGDTFDDDGCHFNLTWWVKVEGDGRVPSIADMIRLLENIEIPSKAKKRTSHGIWTPPIEGRIKVNVDDLFLENSGKGGHRESS